MQPPQQHSWINLVEIKAKIIKKLGLERSNQYFDYLNQFLSLKLSKGEFDKLCLRTVGKDNIRLHNLLIHSVLKNACTGKVSTRIHDDHSGTDGNKKSSDGLSHQNGSVPVVTQTQVTSSPLALANGDILPPSPRKARTGGRDRRVGDRRSALGQNGKTSYASQSLSPSILQPGDFSAVLENGDSASPDTRNAIHHQEPANGDFVGVHPKEQIESLGKKDGKGISGRSSLHAPLGVPFCPVSIGGACRALPSASFGLLHTDSLLETATLKERMEQITAAHGLLQVSMDCANVLNSGLDAYLKGLIRSCVRPLSGVRPRHHHHQIQSSGWSSNAMQEAVPEPKRLVTLLDFRVAMELNHKQLGEDWPVLLEKICAQCFEE